MFKAAVCLLVALSVLSGAQDKPERIDPDVANRNLTKKVEPPVPPLAKAAGIGGTVVVDVVIGATGKVTSVTLISGHPMLAPAFIEAVRKWEYAPFVEDGRATSVITRVEWKVDSPNYSKAQEKALQDYYPAFRTCYDLVRKGNDSQAEPKCRQALSLSDQLPENRVLERSSAREFVGHVLYRQNKFAESVPFYEKAVEIRSTYEHSDSDADFASDNASLARAYAAVGKLSDSDTYYSRAVTVFKAAIADLPSMKDNYTARLKSTLLEYAKLKAAIGQTDEASRLEKEADQL
jgi:TonB family protein